jgi:NAD(P)-dependent dehydrogenase (short-subunit alcohol dehydrogenase family)
MESSRFNSKIVLLIGATGGIGSVLSRKLAAQGASLILFSRNAEKLNELSTELNSENIAVDGDANNYSDLQKAVDRGIETYGHIDILIHAVGSIILKPLHKTEEKDFRDTLELNLVSPFLSIRAVIDHMIQQKSGSVIVISSVAGSKGLMNHEAISAAKGGLEAMIRSASVSYAKKGIRFNAVAPGLVDTPLAGFLTGSEMSKRASLSMHPMGRLGSPSDIADAVMYLASDESSWVTGAVIPVDGGMKAN